MAVPTQTPPPPSYSELAVQRMEQEHKMLANERFLGWAVLWTLFGFKIGTLVIIVWLGRQSSEAGSEKWWAYILSTTWYWFIIPLIALSGLIVWQVRLRKARKQAQQLRRSEFSLLNTSDLGQLTEAEKERLRQVQRLDEHNR